MYSGSATVIAAGEDLWCKIFERAAECPQDSCTIRVATIFSLQTYALIIILSLKNELSR